MPAGPAADVVVEGEYRLPYQEHAYLQPEAGVGYIDEAGPGHRGNWPANGRMRTRSR